MKKIPCIVIATTIFAVLTACSAVSGSAAIKKPAYPQSTSFDDYDGKMKIIANNSVDKSFINSIQDFSCHSASKILAGKSQNVNYSPVSLYMTLALAGTGANGTTQDEIFSVLGIDEKDKGYLSAQAGNLFRQLYFDNKIGKLKIANSLWLQKEKKFNSDFIENATRNFYAAPYNVDFSNENTANLMSKWISDNTNSILVPNITIDKKQIMSVLNTIYFKDEWIDRFDEKNTKPGVFYLENNGQVKCNFMNTIYEMHTFVKGDGFISSSLNLKNSGNMTFILPDKGVKLDDLIATPEKVSSLFNTQSSDIGKVIFQIPKFSFGSELELLDMLKSLGIKSAFNFDADFTGITNDTAFISDIKQQSHIAIDEKGVEAAAFTKIDYAGAALPNEKVAKIILDRPFIYGITSDNGIPLFVGVCRNPTVH